AEELKRLQIEANLQATRERIQAAKDRVREAREARQDRVDSAIASYGPDGLEALGKKFIAGEDPAIGFCGEVGQTAKAAAVKAGVEWAKSHGIRLEQLPAIKQQMAADRAGLTDAEKKRGVAFVANETFHRHIARLVELGRSVPRSEIPAINGAIVRGEKEFQ